MMSDRPFDQQAFDTHDEWCREEAKRIIKEAFGDSLVVCDNGNDVGVDLLIRNAAGHHLCYVELERRTKSLGELKKKWATIPGRKKKFLGNERPVLFMSFTTGDQRGTHYVIKDSALEIIEPNGYFFELAWSRVYVNGLVPILKEIVQNHDQKRI